ncbi:MAG: MBL fold metallo-hydrolase [Rickettsiales bacterium]|nr:MBL fold metallo-hydrolase [Rickettsiales bacterium]
MSDKGKFLVSFWGVRGSIACPGEDTLKYGGNTSCVEVNCGDFNLIFDAGTGMKNLGDKLSGKELNYDIFMSHTHIDHVVGFPFFKPAYSAKSRLKMWAGHLKPRGRTLKGVMESIMDTPLFPIGVDVLEATIIWTDFEAGETIFLSNDVTLETAPLNHTEGATGYRVNFDGKAVCYVTDTEHTPGKLDENILKLIQGADLVIYDSTYTDEEYPTYTGWGHSTWQEGVRLCDAANVKQLAVFHHDPSHTDGFMDGVARELEQMRPGGGLVAREGVTLEI